MKILAIDTSSQAASVCITEDRKPLGEFYIDTKLTHSQTILPMVESVLTCTEISLKEIELFAVSAGPGSFTGLRIGLAAVKGMAFTENKPCMAISTLEALAFNLEGMGGIACAVMDARLSQVYTALFDLDKGVQRLTEDAAMPITDLAQVIKNQKKPVFLVGDGSIICYNYLSEQGIEVSLAAEKNRLQRAYSVALAATVHYGPDTVVTCDRLEPSYLRLPQAQRERLSRMGIV